MLEIARLDQTTATLTAANTRNYGSNLQEESSILPVQDYFDFPNRRELFNNLHDFCSRYNPIGLLLGAIGSGKSTLLNQIYSELKSSQSLLLMQGHTRLNSTQLFAEIIKGFEFQASNFAGEDSYNKIKKLFEEKEGRDFLLIIDDADYLPVETLANLMLLAFDQKQIKLRIILSGENCLQKSVESIQEKHNFVIACALFFVPAFSFAECKNYMEHCLRGLVEKDKRLLNAEIVEKIYGLSLGYPARINRIATQVLLDLKNDKLKTSPKSKKQILDKVIKASILLLIVILGIHVYSSANQTVKTNLQINRVPAAKKHNHVAHILPEVTHTSFVASIANLPEEKLATAEIPSLTFAEPLKSLASIKITHPVSLTHVEMKGYTIQLFALHQKRVLPQNLRHTLQSNLYIYHVRYANKEWDLITYGHFSTEQQARSALSNLPNDIKAHHPWVRAMSSIGRIRYTTQL